MEENRRLQRQRTEYYNNNVHKNKNEIATMMQEILNGDIYIAPLHESNESIGEMEHECQYCGALKFKTKNSRMCCLEGKVNLPSYLEHPEILKDYRKKSEVFRNNATYMSFKC